MREKNTCIIRYKTVIMLHIISSHHTWLSQSYVFSSRIEWNSSRTERTINFSLLKTKRNDNFLLTIKHLIICPRGMMKYVILLSSKFIIKPCIKLTWRKLILSLSLSLSRFLLLTNFCKWHCFGFYCTQCTGHLLNFNTTPVLLTVSI